VAISGNEKADTAALSPCHPMKIPVTDLTPYVRKLISEKRQQFWNSCIGNEYKLSGQLLVAVNRNHSFLVGKK